MSLEIDDLSFFEKKVVRGMKIPASYMTLGPDTSGSIEHLRHTIRNSEELGIDTSEAHKQFDILVEAYAVYKAQLDMVELLVEPIRREFGERLIAEYRALKASLQEGKSDE
jgi:hypothetical protein